MVLPSGGIATAHQDGEVEVEEEEEEEVRSAQSETAGRVNPGLLPVCFHYIQT